MDLNKIIFFIFFSIIFWGHLYAQKIMDKSTPEKPIWISELPQGKYNIYYTGIGESKISLVDAKERAITDVLSEIIMAGKISASSVIKSYHEQYNSEVISKISREIIQKGESAQIKGLKKVEEYWQIMKGNNGIHYYYWILMRLPKQSPGQINDIIYPKKSMIKSLLRSAIIPGWGQYYEHQRLKAVSIFSLQLISISTAFFASNISREYNNKAQNAITINDIEWYSDQSDKYYQISTISFIISFGIYLYNIMDILSAKPDKIYVLNDKYYLVNIINVDSNLIRINYKINF